MHYDGVYPSLPVTLLGTHKNEPVIALLSVSTSDSINKFNIQ